MHAHANGSKGKDATKGRLIHWDQLEPWQRDNEYILTNYRPASNSVFKSLGSVFAVHNETVNMWSHGLGAIAYFLVPCMLYQQAIKDYSSATLADVTALAVFYLSVVVCFVFSSSFHIFLNHSSKAWHTFAQLDHLGIVLVIWGSATPTTYFGFYCDPKTQRTHWTLETAAAIAAGYATFSLRSPAGRKLRTLLYAVLGASAFIPVVHGVWLNGWEVQNARMSIANFIGLGLLNGTGAAIYAARIPERFWPVRFDVVGASHQVMHVLVMCGAWSHAVGLGKAFEYWHERRVLDQDLCKMR